MKRIVSFIMAVLLFLVLAPGAFAAEDIKGHWAEKEINNLIGKGILEGYEDGTIRPDRSVTRAEFAKLVIKSLNLVPDEEPDVVEVSNFPVLTDIVPGEWYYADVIEAVEEGIITGFDDGTFRPNDEITREQMATMIMRAVNGKGFESEPAQLTFTDTGKIQSYALEHVQRIVNLEIMTGMPGNKFAPSESSTRAQVAAVLVRMNNLFFNEPEMKYTEYDLTLEEMIEKQMMASPQTDKYRHDPAFVSAEYVHDIFVDEEEEKTYGYLTNTTFLNVREGPSTDFRQIGRFTSTLENPKEVVILDEVINDKDELWYEVEYGAWRNAKREDVVQYVNPANFTDEMDEYYQFLVLSKPVGVTAEELNSKILVGQGTLEGTGQAFIDASKKYGINELYLVAHALHETGEGFSILAQGVEVDTLVKRNDNGSPILDGNGEQQLESVPKETVYNAFGIGAVDRCPNECGAERAYKEGWFTMEDAIIGGAKYISESYINHPVYKQDTLYKMRWNPADPAKHQYASDVGWAAKQVERIHEMYQQLESFKLYYDIPVYKK